MGICVWIARCLEQALSRCPPLEQISDHGSPSGLLRCIRCVSNVGRHTVSTEIWIQSLNPSWSRALHCWSDTFLALCDLRELRRFCGRNFRHCFWVVKPRSCSKHICNSVGKSFVCLIHIELCAIFQWTGKSHRAVAYVQVFLFSWEPKQFVISEIYLPWDRCGVLLIAVAFFFATLPEITDEMISDESNAPTKPLLRQPHFLGGMLAQWLYVASQVTVAAFFINLVNEDGVHSNSKASQLLS